MRYTQDHSKPLELDFYVTGALSFCTSSSFDVRTANSSTGGGDDLALAGMGDDGRLPGGGPGGGRRPGGERPAAVGVAWGD